MIFRLLFLSLILASTSALAAGPKCSEVFDTRLDHWIPDFTVGRSVVNPLKRNLNFKKHAHSHAQFIFVVHGRGSLEVQGQEIALQPGTFVFIPANTAHRISKVIEPLDLYGGYDVPGFLRKQVPLTGAKKSKKPFVVETEKMDWNQWDPSHPVLTKFILNGTQNYKGTVTAGLARIPSGKDLAHHRHKESEYYVFLRGEGIMYLDGQKILVKPGDVIFVPGDATHHTINTGREPLDFLFLFKEPNFLDIEYLFSPNPLLQ